MVSKSTLERAALVMVTQAQQIREVEIQKEVLCMHKEFVVLTAFCRIAGQEKNHVDTLDLVSFFRDEGLIVSEGDCYMLVRMFDSDGDGLLSLGDITTILCPRSYTYKRHLRGSQKYF